MYCGVCNDRHFLFGINPDVPANKVYIFSNDYKFWFRVNGF